MMMTAHDQVSVELLDGICGEREITRLVELGRSHEQSLLLGIVVTDSQTQQLTTSQTGGVKQHNGQAIELRTEG